MNFVKIYASVKDCIVCENCKILYTTRFDSINKELNFYVRVELCEKHLKEYEEKTTGGAE